MKYNFFLILTILIYYMSCDDEVGVRDPQAFLSSESLVIEELLGEWVWLNTHGGLSGSSKITPATEGYEKSIIFTSKRNYIEIIDADIDYKTFYSIDSTKLNHDETSIFRIKYFDDEKKSQDFIIHNENDTLYLYLYDKDCRDCLSTHVFQKNNN